MKKTYTIPDEERTGVLINLEEAFEKKDVDFVKKFFHLKTLEHQFNTTLIVIFNDMIQNGKIRIISFNQDVMKIEVNGKTGFLPGIWLGDLTEQQALHIEEQLNPQFFRDVS